MFEIIKAGLIESDDQLKELAHSYGEIVIPNENGDLDMTHWWVIKDSGTEMLYVGTPATFTQYISERNGGIQ